MKHWCLILAGVALFMLALLMTTPARLLRKALPAGVDIVRLEGSVWQGRAVQVRWQGQPMLDQLDWDWKTARLLTLQLVFDIRSSWQGREGKARISSGLSSVALQDADLTLPLDPFTAMVPQLASFRLRGNLNVVTRDFTWSEGRGAGELGAEWRDARSDFSGDAVMGSYRIDLKAADKGYAVKVGTLDGVLKISGDGSGSPGQGWNVGTVIQVPPGQLPQFQSLLSRVGPPNPDGKYVLRYSFK